MAIKKAADGREMEISQIKTGGVMEKFVPILIMLVVVMAFGLGSLWSKVRYLESGGTDSLKEESGASDTAKAAPTAKYKTITQALEAYAKVTGLDATKLVKCVDSGEKAKIVEADYQQGTELGVRGTPGFFINGKFLGGAFPLPSFKEVIDREIDGTGSVNYADYKETNLLAAGAGANPAFIAKPVTVDLGKSAVRGEDGAKVTIVEYIDFQCPYCTQGYNTMKQISGSYGDKVRFVYKHYPLSQIHPLAQKTSEAFECARDQGEDKAFKLHDLLFDKQSEWAAATL